MLFAHNTESLLAFLATFQLSCCSCRVEIPTRRRILPLHHDTLDYNKAAWVLLLTNWVQENLERPSALQCRFDPRLAHILSGKESNMDPPPTKKQKLREGGSSRPSSSANNAGQSQTFNCRVKSVDREELPPFVSTCIPHFNLHCLPLGFLHQSMYNRYKQDFPGRHLAGVFPMSLS